MGCPDSCEIESNLVFSITTHDPDTGILTDADAAPAYRVYEEETAVPILTGTMSKLDDANTTGFYTETLVCTEANGFEDNKIYTIYIQATVDGDTGANSFCFRAYESLTASFCPVSLAEMKLHLRVTSDTEDSLIEQLMLAATSWAEEFQRRTYITRSRTYYLDKFPSIIRPPYSPLVIVSSIQYVDTDGVTQTLDAAEYRVDTDTEPGRITQAYECTWPDIRDLTNAVIVTYTSGYGTSADVPDEIKAAIKLLVGHLYEHREAASEIIFEELPLAVKSLLWMGKIV